MDPDANLVEQRSIVKKMQERFDRVDEKTGEYSEQDKIDQLHDGDRLVELVEALDGWISGGGFLPARWQKAQR
jgi:hypothetical protein